MTRWINRPHTARRLNMNNQNSDIADAPNPPENRVTSRLYDAHELLFGGVAERVHANGWTLLPQERGERRRTSLIDHRALKWGAYIDEAPPAEEVRYWAMQAPRANGAILLGPPSGNVFCFDIDVMDSELSYAIQELAHNVMGRTRFTRKGQAPKAALFYRVEREEDLPKNRAYRFAGDEGHLLEVQARGKMITAYGYHHVTDRYFRWRGPQPVTHLPTDVPLVTPELIAEFIEAVQDIRPFDKKASGTAPVIIEGDGTLEVSAEGWTIPRINAGVLNEATGLIDDDRERWLNQLAFNLVRLNPERASASPTVTIEVAYGHAQRKMDCNGRDVRGDLVDKINRAVDSLRRGEIRNLPKVRERADGTREMSQRGALPGTSDPDLWHLPPADQRKAIEIKSRSKPDSAKAEQRAVETNRSAIADSVSSQLDDALSAFFDEVYSGDAEQKTAHVLKVPTGGGKTTRTISYAAHDPRTFRDIAGEDSDRSGPILFLLPTYNNIDELRVRTDIAAMDPNAPDDVLAQQAEAAGIMTLEQAEAAIDDLRAAAQGTGLMSMTYKGKVAAGCRFPKKMQDLQEAGISTSGMCKARIKDPVTGEPEERTCPFYSSCEAILQKARIAASHVVFLPHAFLNLSIPDELKTVRAVVVDERVFPLVMHTTQFKLSTLELERKAPHLTKKEREIASEGHVSGDEKKRAIDSFAEVFLQDRREAATVAVAALRAGDCPAGALSAFQMEGGKTTGAELVKSALRVCGSASSTNVAIYPGMPDHVFDELVTRPTGSEIRLEYRFWKIIEERIDSLEKESHTQSREQRIQLRRDTVEVEGELKTAELVRLSWRSELNWPSAPLLLLDASADESITRKAFPDRMVIMHDISAPLNLKTVLVTDRRRSTRSLTPQADIASQDAVAAARAVEQVRAVETALAARHSNGRMITGMAKRVRSLTRQEYLSPANVDDLHFGAERGLNFAESHVAALSLGRLEMPVWTLDGLAAALGYDDEEDLILLDPRGDGTDVDGNPSKPAVSDLRIDMRDGSDVVIESAQAPTGTWQRTVQIQFRDESIRQFAGRLRPVYRTDTPILYVLSQCLPDGFIVDDIVSTDDLIPSYAPLLDAARSIDGILDHVLCHAARPDLATKDQYRDSFAKLPAALKAGYWALRYKRRGVERFAGVPAHHADPVAVLERNLQAHGVDYSDIEIVREPINQRVEPADVRPSDDIEIALGDRTERQAAEDAARERAVKWLGDRHKADTSHAPYIAGRGRFVVGKDRDGRDLQLGLGAIALLTRPESIEVVEDQDNSDDAIPHSYMTADDWDAAAAM